MRPRAIRASSLLFAAALVSRRWWPQRVEVVGSSMLPTLQPGDRLVAWRGRVRPGDLVVVGDPRDPTRPLVKRVAHRDGLVVELRGDNPSASTDSRTFGGVPVGGVRGRLRYRYAPEERRGRVR